MTETIKEPMGDGEQPPIKGLSLEEVPASEPESSPTNTQPAKTLSPKPRTSTLPTDPQPTDPSPDIPEESEGYRMVERIAGISEQIAHLEAERLKLIRKLHDSEYMRPLSAPPSAQAEAKRMDRPLRDLDREDTTRAELMLRLRLRPSDARRLVETAITLTGRFPQTLEALSQGGLDLTRAMVIGEVAAPLADDHHDLGLRAGKSPGAAEQMAQTIAKRLEDHILKRASTQAPDNLRGCLHRTINRLDPGYADRHVKDNLKARQVTHRTNRGEGTGDLYAHLGAAEALAAYNVIDTYARAARQGGSKRNLNELRADAFTDLILYGHLPDGSTLTKAVDVDTENATVVPDVDPNTGDIRLEPSDQSTGRVMCPGSAMDAALATSIGSLPATAGATGTATATRTASATGTASATTTTTNAGSATGSASATDAGSATNAGSAPATGSAITTTGNGSANSWTSRSALRTHVQVTVGLETLLGLDEEPGDLAGHGPITAATARDLAFASGSIWRRLVTDPVTGYLLDYGRKTYRPPAALGDHVRARDVTCRTPNCIRAASKCQLDHIISWPAGATSEGNLATECDHDHRLKHEGHWTHQVSDDPTHPPGTIVMISPTGHVYLSYPYTYTDPRLKQIVEQDDSADRESTAPPSSIDHDPGPPPF